MSLADAHPEPWKAEKAPDPTPEDLALGVAARRFAMAAEAVEQHEGPRSGPDYAAKLEAWRSSYQALRIAAGQHPGEDA